MTTEKKIPKGCVCNLLSTATCARGAFRCDRRHKVTTADQDTLRAELDAAKVRETRLLGLIQSTPCTIYEAGHGECRALLTDVLMMCDRCRALVEAGDPHA